MVECPDLPSWKELKFITNQYHGIVLDAGCSNGDYTLCLRELPNVQGVISLDIQAVKVPHHNKRFSTNVSGGTFWQGDIQAMPMFQDNQFDCILCWDMLQNVKDAPKAFREFVRVTKPGGLVSVRTVIKDRIPWVIPGVTVEKGSSGYPFVAWTIWNPEDLSWEGRKAGLDLIGQVHIDPWNHMTGFFKVVK